MVYARIAWIASVLLLTVLQVAGQAAALQNLRSVSLNPPQIQELEGMGLSVDSYALWNYASELLLPLTWGILGLLIFLRRSDDRAALVLSAMMVGIGVATSIPTWKAFVHAWPQWSWLVLIGGFIGNFCIFSFSCVFPTGRYVPRWTIGSAVVLGAYNILNSYDFAMPAPLVSLGQSLDWAFPLLFIGFFASFIIAPVYRYRRVSGPMEREQIKWVVFTMACAILVFIATAMTVFLPGGNPDQDISFTTVFLQPLGWSAPQLIPFAIAVAILRYRLFDIDIIIRRTLIYGALTAVLALFYLGSVVLLQQLLRLVTGQSSEIAIIISTLAIAVLFVPLRRRVQEWIDRRFYRRKYDATKVLAAFGATARDEVELAKLVSELVNVVGDTMQPQSVSLWLNKKGRGAKR